GAWRGGAITRKMMSSTGPTSTGGVTLLSGAFRPLRGGDASVLAMVVVRGRARVGGRGELDVVQELPRRRRETGVKLVGHAGQPGEREDRGGGGEGAGGGGHPRPGECRGEGGGAPRTGG